MFCEYSLDSDFRRNDRQLDRIVVTSQKVRVRLKLWKQAAGQGELLHFGLQCLK
jgi:hypothetical protein